MRRHRVRLLDHRTGLLREGPAAWAVEFRGLLPVPQVRLLRGLQHLHELCAAAEPRHHRLGVRLGPLGPHGDAAHGERGAHLLPGLRRGGGPEPERALLGLLLERALEPVRLHGDLAAPGLLPAGRGGLHRGGCRRQALHEHSAAPPPPPGAQAAEAPGRGAEDGADHLQPRHRLAGHPHPPGRRGLLLLRAERAALGRPAAWRAAGARGLGVPGAALRRAELQRLCHGLRRLGRQPALRIRPGASGRGGAGGPGAARELARARGLLRLRREHRLRTREGLHHRGLREPEPELGKGPKEGVRDPRAGDPRIRAARPLPPLPRRG
mmetsp:Transcript_91272/g.282335  ORF Transcript_91272/g.282335 Transcript_91272/m.282335 type:complete len:324 (+) Transcript_91272:1128-2099(+)